ncbi:MAG: HRDC domain-containing protein [Deltaproteobacteria bacterium]|nr:HRDC domain-containing protein [Deltaproteobacteria bacterium]
MRLRFFTIPVFDSDAAQAELDRFLATHRIVTIDRELIAEGLRSAWAICVAHHVSSATATANGTPNASSAAKTKRRQAVDYREVLNAADFRVFARLRTLRKTVATRDEVPAYAVFTNELLAAMITERVRTLEDLRRTHGVRDARIDKYGEAFVSALGQDVADPIGPTDDEAPDAP